MVPRGQCGSTGARRGTQYSPLDILVIGAFVGVARICSAPGQVAPRTSTDQHPDPISRITPASLRLRHLGTTPGTAMGGDQPLPYLLLPSEERDSPMAGTFAFRKYQSHT